MPGCHFSVALNGYHCDLRYVDSHSDLKIASTAEIDGHCFSGKTDLVIDVSAICANRSAEKKSFLKCSGHFTRLAGEHFSQINQPVKIFTSLRRAGEPFAQACDRVNDL